MREPFVRSGENHFFKHDRVIFCSGLKKVILLLTSERQFSLYQRAISLHVRVRMLDFGVNILYNYILAPKEIPKFVLFLEA